MVFWSNFPLIEPLSVSVEASQRAQKSCKYMSYQKHCSQTCNMLIWCKFSALIQLCSLHFDKFTFYGQVSYWIRQFLFASLQLHIRWKRCSRSPSLSGRDYPTSTVFESLVCFPVSNTCSHFLKQIMITSENYFHLFD